LGEKKPTGILLVLVRERKAGHLEIDVYAKHTLDHVTKEGDSPVFAMKISFLSIALNVNSCLKIAVPSAKPKYILSNR